MFITLKPRGERLPMKQVTEGLRKKLREVPGISVFLRPIQNLQLGGRPSKAQFQYILQSVQGGELSDWAVKLQDKLRGDQLFRDVTSDSQLRGLQASLRIDRDRANTLGVSIDALRSALFSAFGERQVSTIYTSVDSYQVIMELAANARQDESAFNNIYVRSSTGALCRCRASRRSSARSGDLDQPRRAAAGGDGVVQPRAGRRAGRCDDQARAVPRPDRHAATIITSYGGDAAVFKSSQGSQAILIIGALLVIYVLLGVLYESYIHPLTILAGLPSAAVGALLTLRLFDQDLTLIATIGILLLIGIVKKNAIMMIDFALDAQRTQGMARSQAIREACVLRFRPIMMTTLAALMGALPIALGLGAGAELRQPLGLAVGRRAGVLAGDHAVHHAGDLPGARPLQRQGADHDARGGRGGRLTRSDVARRSAVRGRRPRAPPTARCAAARCRPAPSAGGSPAPTGPRATAVPCARARCRCRR
jgi:HAE1 family hydrophobic/amphiphilic exporter-1